jgi:hypothetical protein
MRFILFLLLLSSTTLFSQKTGRKIYFLDSTIFKPTDELVLIVDRPQSTFAKTLGSRIYSDSNTIKKICTSFYFTKEVSNKEDETSLFCGYDLYFYIKKENELELIQALNSDCQLNIIGGKENLLLLELGEKISIDTLNEAFRKRYKDSIFQNTFLVKERFLDDKNFQAISWCELSNDFNFPKWYYDGKVTIQLNNSDIFKTNESIEEFIKSFGIIETKKSQINWCGNKKNSTGTITFYIKKELFHYFDDYDLIKYTNRDYKRFFEDKKYTYLLFKTP